MLRISNKVTVGSLVLFVWENIPFTGRVMSIGTNTYGILCDADKYTTDRFNMPRNGNEVYIEKRKCIKTGEVIPLSYRNGENYRVIKVGNVITAYNHLPKKTLTVSIPVSTNTTVGLKPDKYILQLNDTKYYLYTRDSNGLTILIDIENEENKKVPKWTGDVLDEFIDPIYIEESHILSVYEIPDRYLELKISPLDAVKNSYVNLVYKNKDKFQIPLTHPVRGKFDMDLYNHLPEKHLYDYNCHTK